jgi:hypothetical protein
LVLAWPTCSIPTVHKRSQKSLMDLSLCLLRTKTSLDNILIRGFKYICILTADLHLDLDNICITTGQITNQCLLKFAENLTNEPVTK